MDADNPHIGLVVGTAVVSIAWGALFLFFAEDVYLWAFDPRPAFTTVGGLDGEPGPALPHPHRPKLLQWLAMIVGCLAASSVVRRDLPRGVALVAFGYQLIWPFFWTAIGPTSSFQLLITPLGEHVGNMLVGPVAALGLAVAVRRGWWVQVVAAVAAVLLLIPVGLATLRPWVRHYNPVDHGVIVYRHEFDAGLELTTGPALRLGLVELHRVKNVRKRSHGPGRYAPPSPYE